MLGGIPMIRAPLVLIAFAVVLVSGATLAAYRFLTQPAQQTPFSGLVPQTPPADLVLRGGRIVTLDDETPEAQALAARDGRIVAIGSNAQIAGYIGSST